MNKNVIRITENELKQIVAESVNKILNERRDKITPKTFNIDGVDYESTNKIKGGGAWHPGFRFKDHESHNPNKLKSYRKRKDGYRYAQSYAGRPDDLHKNLTSEGRITESELKRIVNESVRRILSEDIDNPWVYEGYDKWGEFYGTIFIGKKIFNNVMSKYQHEFNDELDDFENFMDNLESDPIHVQCGWENSPSINVYGTWIEDFNLEDLKKMENEISTYPNQMLVKQALSVIDEVLENLSIDEVEVEEEPEQDYPDDDY